MIEIPLTVPVPPRATFTMDLAGVTVTFTLRWNSATSGWYIDTRTAAEADVVLGRRLTVGRPIGWRSLDPRFPVTGWLVVIDTTGAQEDPGYTDLGTRHRLLFVDRSDIPRIPVDIRRQLDPRAFVPVDGPEAVYVPETDRHWQALGIEPPTNQVSTQVSSGNLTALIGGTAMTTSGTGQTYQQTVTSWNRNLVAKPDGQTGYWEFASALNLGATDSFAALMYIAADFYAAAALYMEFYAGANRFRQGSADGEIDLLWNSVAATDITGVNQDVDLIVPYLLSFDGAGSTAYLSTLAGVTSASHPGGPYSGSVRTRYSSGGLFKYGPLMAFWVGADADALIAAGHDQQGLFTALGWTVS